MPSVTWDSAFEASPADTDEAKYGATKIRQLKLAVSERGELEENWKLGTQPFHKAGKCSVLFIGTTTEINALTGMPLGSIAWDTTLSVLKAYNGSAWITTEPASVNLSTYLKKDLAGQTILESVAVTNLKTIDGRDISVDGAALDALIAATPPPTNPLGAWATKVTDTVYLAATDGFVCAKPNTAVTLAGYTDASNPPSTLMAQGYTYSGIQNSTITFPVRKGDYWKVVGGTEFVYWIPLGS